MPIPKLQNYTIEDEKYFHIHLVLTNYCNNRCTYCGQYGEYGEDHFDFQKLKDTIMFFHTFLQGKKYRFYLEWGEPTKYIHFIETLEFLHSINEQIVVLSNGRVVDPAIRSALWKHFANGTIWHIAAHLPVWKEPLSLIWNKEAFAFFDYMYREWHQGSFVLVGIMHSVFDCRVSLWLLLRWFSYFPWLIKSIELGFPHPNPMEKDFMDYESRLNSMQYIMKFFDYCNKHHLDIGLWGFMLCLLEHGIKHFWEKYEYMRSIFLDPERKVDMDKSIELHIDHNGKITVLCSLSGTSYVEVEWFFQMRTYEIFKSAINRQIERFYQEKIQRIPSLCQKCNYNGNGCSGDHFNLVSEYEKIRA